MRPRIFEVVISGGETFLVNAAGFTDAMNMVNHYTVNHSYAVTGRQIESVRHITARLIGLRAAGYDGDEGTPP